jgi:post-segregation antitoxin (ccd killing protein)
LGFCIPGAVELGQAKSRGLDLSRAALPAINDIQRDRKENKY